MQHARRDYDRIQDPAGKIPADEPVFLLRAQDPAGADTVRFWAEQAEAAGTEARVVEAVRSWADQMDGYRVAGPAHGPADVPAGMLHTEPAPKTVSAKPGAPIRVTSSPVLLVAVDPRALFVKLFGYTARFSVGASAYPAPPEPQIKIN